VNYLI